MVSWRGDGDRARDDAGGAQIAPRLVWNASASAPLGLYWVAGKSTLDRGDLVLAELPESVRGLADERGYLPAGVPLIKPVARFQGSYLRHRTRNPHRRQRCRQAAETRFTGRPMPAWDGCRLLTADEIFLLNADVPDSFDGRYFGPTRMDEVIGRLVPLWTWPVGQR